MFHLITVIFWYHSSVKITKELLNMLTSLVLAHSKQLPEDKVNAECMVAILFLQEQI
jgi:hypothetical protein